jgi:hypothetical protein
MHGVLRVRVAKDYRILYKINDDRLVILVVDAPPPRDLSVAPSGAEPRGTEDEDAAASQRSSRARSVRSDANQRPRPRRLRKTACGLQVEPTPERSLQAGGRRHQIQHGSTATSPHNR